MKIIYLRNKSINQNKYVAVLIFKKDIFKKRIPVDRFCANFDQIH